MKNQTFRGFVLDESSILSKEQLKTIKGGINETCIEEGYSCDQVGCCSGLTCTEHLKLGVTVYECVKNELPSAEKKG